jgi:hypothetical protein
MLLELKIAANRDQVGSGVVGPGEVPYSLSHGTLAERCGRNCPIEAKKQFAPIPAPSSHDEIDRA